MVRRRIPDAGPWPALLAFLLFAAAGGGVLWWILRGLGTGEPASAPAPPPGLGAAGTLSPFDAVSVRAGVWRLAMESAAETGRDPAAAAELLDRVRAAVAWVREGRFEDLYPEAAGRPREVVVRLRHDPPAGLVTALRRIDGALVLEDLEGRTLEKRVAVGVPRVAGPGDDRGVAHPGVVDLVTLDPDGGGVTLTAYENRPWDGSEGRLDEVGRKLGAYEAFVEEGGPGRIAGREAGPPPARVVLRCRHRPTPRDRARLAAWRKDLERAGIGFEVQVAGEEGGEEVLDLD